jgi:hypothetical protein
MSGLVRGIVSPRKISRSRKKSWPVPHSSSLRSRKGKTFVQAATGGLLGFDRLATSARIAARRSFERLALLTNPCAPARSGLGFMCSGSC